MKVLASFLVLAAAASSAHAQFTNNIKLSAQYKETKKGDAVFRNIFVTGTARFPDGVVLSVMVRPEDASYLPLTMRATVEKGEFAAEMGPWKAGFPPGTYVCEAWFEIDRQSEPVKAALRETDEFAKCLVSNPDYQKEYKEKNPERYEKLMRQIELTGKCTSDRQYGATQLKIGTAEEAAQSKELDRAVVRDRADLMFDMLADLEKTRSQHVAKDKGEAFTKDTWNAWAGPFRDMLADTDKVITERVTGSVFNSYKPAYDHVAGALRALAELERITTDCLYGDSSKMLAECAALEARSDLDKDEKRRRDVLKREAAALDEAREAQQRAVLDGVAQAIYGRDGLTPAPERLKKWIQDQKSKCGYTWKD